MRKYDHQVIINAYKNGMSYPDLERKYGINRSHACRIMQKAGVNRTVSEGLMLALSGRTVWRKLICMGGKDGVKHPTRILSIPGSIISQLGFQLSAPLLGKWEIVKDGLLLKIRVDDQ